MRSREAIRNHVKKHNMTFVAYGTMFKLNATHIKETQSTMKEERLKSVQISSDITEVIEPDDDMDEDDMALWNMANGRWRVTDIGTKRDEERSNEANEILIEETFDTDLSTLAQTQTISPRIDISTIALDHSYCLKS